MYKIYANGELLHDPRLSLDGLVVADPSVTMQINSHGSAEFTVPVINPLYSAIQPLTTMISIWDDSGEMFRGRVLEVEKDFYNSLKVYCEGALAFLLDTVKEAHSFNGKAANLFRALITQHSEAMPENKQFVIGEISAVYENTTIVYDEEEARSTWEMLNTHLLDNIGGFIRARAADGVFYIDYLADYAGTSSQEIRFGENLLDMERGASGADIFTRLIPYGKRLDSGKRVDITSVNGGVNYIVNSDLEKKYGVIYRTEVFDDAETAADLLSAAQSRIAQPAMTQTVEATALDLLLVDPSIERIEVGQFFRLYSVPHDVSALMLCSKIAYDLGDPSKTKITLGQLSDTITSQVASGVTSSSASGGSGGGSGDLTAIEIATEAKEIAEQAQVDAQTAASTANAASATASAASESAEEAQALADNAAATASSASATAAEAKSTADGLSDEVTAASAAAESAQTTADAAKQTADQAAADASSAASSAQEALTAAGNASSAASAAQTAADNAASAAGSASEVATAAQTAADAAKTTADGAAQSAAAAVTAADAATTVANAAKQTAEAAQSAVDGKAPMDHASTSTEYGVAQSNVYGHVVLINDVSQSGGPSTGAAASANAVRSVLTVAREAKTAAGDAQATATGATQAAAEALTAADAAQTTADAAQAAASAAQTTAEEAKTDANNKAPISHASNATTYGKSTSSLYGHVKLSDSVSSTLSAASGGTAATPAAVKAVHDLLGGAKVITGTATIDYGTSMKYADVTFGYTFQNPPFVIAMQVFNGIPLACMIGSVTKTGARFSLQGDFTSNGSREFRWLGGDQNRHLAVFYGGDCRHGRAQCCTGACNLAIEKTAGRSGS